MKSGLIYLSVINNFETSQSHGAKGSKLCGKSVFPQNFLTKKFGEFSVFYAMSIFVIGFTITSVWKNKG